MTDYELARNLVEGTQLALASGLTTLHGASSGTSYETVMRELALYEIGLLRVRINQMVTNLASNSIKFTREGEVSIRFYRRSKKLWAMEVTDTGPGIPKEAHKAIFEPFRQADGTIPRKFGGTGLGLSIVKHLTTLMDGRIVVKSKVGSGSTFTVILPLNIKAPK